jgi:hypothetical protein
MSPSAFAINVVRAIKSKGNIRLRQKCATSQLDYLAAMLGYLPG